MVKPVTKLQIGVKKRIPAEDCPIKTRNEDNLPVSSERLISTCETRSRLSLFQSHASRQDREFLSFSLMLRDEIGNFFLSVPCFETYRKTANATAVQFNGALCMHCTHGCFTADINTELRADFQSTKTMKCYSVGSSFQSPWLCKMVRHFTTEQRAWIVARKNRGDTLAEIQACFIQVYVHVCE